MHNVFLCLLFATLPDLHVAGPAKVRPGDQAILKVERRLHVDTAACPEKECDAYAFRWLLIDSEKLFWDDGKRISFTTNDPGRYTFLFVYSDGQTIATLTHVLAVDGSPPSPSPTPGPSPDPSPGPSRFGIAEAARQWVAEVPASHRSKGSAFAKRCEEIAKPVIDGHVAPERQALINDLIAATNATLGTSSGPWGTFLQKMKAYIGQLDRDGKLATSKDIAEMIAELGKGVASG